MKPKTYIEIELSDFQKENLKKLSDYLLKGELKADFDMLKFSDNGDFATLCGSVGCAVGHGTDAGIKKFHDEDWSQYSWRCFINKWNSAYHSYAWEWCFDAYWTDTDNTPEGAAKRIQILLNKGLPNDWGDQINGEIPLEYK
jgi:hypothetical protein